MIITILRYKKESNVFWMEANIRNVSLNEQGEMEFRFEPEQNQTTAPETQALVLTVATTGPNVATRYGYCIVGRTYDKFERTHHTSTTANLSGLSGYKITEITSYDGETSLPDENMYHWPNQPTLHPYQRQKMLYETPFLVNDEWIKRRDYLVHLVCPGLVDLTIYIEIITKSRSLFDYGRLEPRVKLFSDR